MSTLYIDSFKSFRTFSPLTSFLLLVFSFFIGNPNLQAQSIDDVPAQCTDSDPIQLDGNPSGGTFSGLGVSPSGLFDPSISNIGNNTITYHVNGNSTQITIEVGECEEIFSGVIFNDCGSDRSFESLIEGMVDIPLSGDVCMDVPNPSNVTRVIAEIWVENQECDLGVPEFVTYSFDGTEVNVKGIIAEQTIETNAREYFYRYVFEGNPSEVCLSDKNFCIPTGMALYIERDVENATSSITTYDYELHHTSTPSGQADCILDSLFLGQNDVDRDINIAIPIHEKDNVRTVEVVVNIKTLGSDDILATNTMEFTTQNAGNEAGLYNIVFEDVPGGGNLAEITICSPDPDGDSFGVGSITASTNEICITCVLEGEVTGDEICADEEATISADYTSTSYEGFDNTGDELQVFYEWETGETTPSINVSPTETTDYGVTITDELDCEIIELVTVIVNDVTVDFSGEYTGADEFCEDAGKQFNLGSATPLGGFYSGDGVEDDGNGETFTFDPEIAGPGEHIVTYEYTDENDCMDSDQITITVHPDIHLATEGSCNNENTIDIELTIDGGSGGFEFEWTGPNNFSSTSQNISELEPGTYFVTVTDANLCSQTANHTEEACCLPPTIDCPIDLTVQCDDSVDPTNTGNPTTGEGCGNVVVSFEDTENEGDCPNERVISRVWTAVDDEQNEISCTQVITVIDDQAPVFEEAPIVSDYQCIEDVPPPGELMWWDNCDGSGTALGADFSDGNTCPETITRIWSYADACGNVSVVRRTFQVNDTETPVLSTSDSDQDLGCNPTVVAPEFSVIDNCLDASLDVEPTTAGPQFDGCNYFQTWTANYTDGCQNEADPISITYTWIEDTQAPEITTQQVSMDLGCNPIIDDPVFEVMDNCLASSLEVTPTTAGASNDGCSWTQTWTANYTDACDNDADPVSITYTWTEDTEPPVIFTSDSDQDLGCNPTILEPVFEVTDNCMDITLDVLPTTSGPSNEGCLYQQTWSANYIDGCGNVAETVSVTYTWTEDLEAPVITTLDINQDLGCNPVVTAPSFAVDDNCLAQSLDLTPTTSGPTSDGCMMTQTWTANYTDACDNDADPVSITYTWIEDLEMPVINTPSVSADLGCNPTIVEPTFSVDDNCLAASIGISPETSGVIENGCSASQTWTANYIDACGNVAETVSITYTWTTTTDDPVITTDSQNTDLGCNPTIEAPVFVVSDNCLDATMNLIPATDGPINDGCSYSQTWTATYGDQCGNPATPVSITYTWTEDLEIPVINTPNVSADLGCNPTIVEPTFSVDDNCLDESLDLTPLTTGPANDGCSYSQTWTANYTDACGNVAETVSITYTWTEDLEIPVINTLNVSADLGCNPTIVDPTFSVDDNCMDETIDLTPVTAGPANDGCSYSQTWTANYIDACGNVAETVSITYTWVEDLEIPVINTPNESTDLGCNPTIVDPTFSVDDNCLAASVSISPETSGVIENGCSASQTWTANYIDACGNVAETVSITYTWVEDLEIPVIKTPNESTDLGCNPTIVDPTFSVDDNCMDETIDLTPVTAGPANDGCSYSQTWTANYIDACGNVAETVTITYTWVEDLEIPVISTPNESADLGCNPTIVDPTFSVDDNCLAASISISPEKSGVIENGCSASQTWTANYIDACGNVAETVTITYTWTTTTDDPVITTDNQNAALGCNPTIEAPVFVVSDNCLDATMNLIPATDGPINDGCSYSQTWTATYGDQCGNPATPVSITYTWTEDLEIPVINTPNVSADLGCNPTVIDPTFSVDDNCLDESLDITPLTTGPANDGCSFTQTWTANYTDACGNVAETVNITYTWTEDLEIPVINTLNVSADLGCNPTIADPTFSVDDNCMEETIDLTPVTAGPSNEGCSYSQTWTANYIDACGNVAETVTITYTWVEDLEMPVINTPNESIDLGCNPTIVEPTFSVDDNCLAASISISPETSGVIENGCSASQTWTANYIDACGNVAETVTITYTWTTTTDDPVITTDNQNADLGCNPTIEAPVFVVSDNCLDATMNLIPATDGPINDGCSYSQTWTATYGDQCGNPATPVSITYTWTEDLEIPVINTPNVSADLGCNPTIVEPTFSVDDNCLDESLDITPLTTGPANDGCSFTQTWTANYTDACGNVAETVTITYTWTEDLEIPVINTLNVSADLGCNPTIVEPTFSVDDNCMEETIDLTPVTAGPSNDGCSYSQTWTANYIDACGNVAETVTITYTWVEDLEMPVISTPNASAELGCNPVIVDPTFTVSDNCLEEIMQLEAITDGPINDGCNYSQTWIANYTDGCGNVAETVTIIYTWTEDTENPVISSDVISANLGFNPTVIAPVFTVSDNCLDMTMNIEAVTDGPVVEGCEYYQIWTANYSDGCNNPANEVSIRFDWVIDTELPVITTTAFSGDLGCNPTVVPPTFTLDDNCNEGVVNLEPTTTGPMQDGCSFTQTWNATFTDDAGNVADPVSITYSWTVDTEAPMITSTEVSQDLGCNPTLVPPVFTVDDNCLDMTMNLEAVTEGPVFDGCSYSQTWTANYSDACDNAAEANIVVFTWVEDTEQPVITSNASGSTFLGCNIQVVPPSFTVVDNCLQTELIIEAETEGPIQDGCSFTQTWIASYSDGCENVAEEVEVTYTWIMDDEAPEIGFVNPALVGMQNGETMQVQCYGQNPEWQLAEALASDVTISDNCGSAVIDVSEIVLDEGDCVSDGYIKRFRCTWTATDGCGNSDSLYIFMEIVDEIPPVITGVPADVTVVCTDTPEIPNTVTATDECLCADLEFSETEIDDVCIDGQVIERTWTATDCCGNTTSSTQRIYLTDNAAPSLQVNLPGGVTLTDVLELQFDCNSGGIPSEYLDLSEADAEMLESCSGIPTVEFESDLNNSSNCIGGILESYEFEWTAYDACMNLTTATLKITVIDTVPPSIINAEERICADAGGEPFIYALDACGNATLSSFDIPVEDGCGNEIERVYEAYDACGNFTTFRQRIILGDVTAPSINLIHPDLMGLSSGDTITITCQEQAVLGNNYGLEDAEFIDECNFDLVISYEEELVSALDCEGEDGKLLVMMKWSAEDFCGNLFEYVLYSKIIDDEAPFIEGFEQEITVACQADIPELDVRDNCGAFELVVNYYETPGSCPNNYDVLRTIVATDECGNVLETSQIIHVVDIQGPQILGLDPYVCEDLDIPEVSAIDNCGQGEVEISMVQDTINNLDCDAGFLIRRTWTATDLCGNSTEMEQIITFSDNTPPSLIFSGTIEQFMGGTIEVPMSDVQMSAEMEDIDWYSILAKDACMGEILEPVYSESIEPSLDCVADGFYEKRTHSWYFEDACGNVSQVQVNLLIIDDIPPELVNVPEGANFGCNPIPELGNIEPPVFEALTDSMTGSITFTEVEEMDDDIMTISNIWTATDECGNVTTAVQALSAIINSDLTAAIETNSDLRCNSHMNQFDAVLTGGQGPFIYEWEVEGNDCQIQAGQGTESVFLYIGFSTAKLKLTVTDANDCQYITEFELVCVSKGEDIDLTQDPGSEDDFSFMIQSISPNPSVDHFTLTVTSDIDRDITYQVVDVLGRSIHDKNMSIEKGKNMILVDVDDFPGGTYFVRISDDQVSDMKKFMKIK